LWLFDSRLTLDVSRGYYTFTDRQIDFSTIAIISYLRLKFRMKTCTLFNNGSNDKIF
jgi:hypothetical protein